MSIESLSGICLFWIPKISGAIIQGSEGKTIGSNRKIRPLAQEITSVKQESNERNCNQRQIIVTEKGRDRPSKHHIPDQTQRNPQVINNQRAENHS